MGDNEGQMTFWDHLDVLRAAIVRVVVVALLCAVVAFCFKELLFDVLLAPSRADFITYRLLNRIASTFAKAADSFAVQLINTALAQQFMIHIKMSFVVGLLAVSPYILYELLRFISPAFYASERRYVYSMVGSGYLMFFVGLLLCYFLIFPLTFRFLGTYQVDAGVVNMISLESYISTLTGMTLMMGLVFEMPVLCWLFAKMGLLNGDFMRHYRRHAVVLILVLSAVITPTSDIFTLALVSLPLWLLYELSIVVVSRVQKSTTK